MRHYPFINPNIATQSIVQQAVVYEDKVTAEQKFNKIVEEVMLKKNREKMLSGIEEQMEKPKCKMHPVRASKTCRQCKAI